jgi:hypothetical protein
MNLVPMQDIERMGMAVAKSNLFGIKTQEQAVALMLIAQAEGLHPAIAARDYHVIQGRPALKADAMLARFQAAGGKVDWKTYTDAEVTGVFSHPNGGSVTLTWTLEQAKRIGLAGKDNWKNYPRAMLRARVISEGIRTVYPGAVVGVYTPEEVEDFKPSERIVGSGSAATVDLTPDTELAEAVEPITEDSLWILQVPGRETMNFASQSDWTEGLMNLVDKVVASKLDVDSKNGKLGALKAANSGVFTRMGIRNASAIYKEIAAKMQPLEAAEADEIKKRDQFVEEMNQEFGPSEAKTF